MQSGGGVVIVFGARELKELAIRTFLGSGHLLAIADEATNPNLAWADVPIVLPDFQDTGAAVAAVARRVGGEPVRAVLSLWDLFLPMAAAVAGHYNLPYLTPDALLLLRNKHLMRQRLAERGVPCPGFQALGSWDEARDAARRLGYPLVLKPTDRAGSIGVIRVDGAADLRRAFDEIRPYSRNGVLLAEEFMTGGEVSVECYVYRGEPHVVTVTDKLVTDGPYFVEMGHTLPSRAGGGAIRFLGGPSGCLREVRYPASDQLPPEVVRLTLCVRPGQTLGPVIDNDARRGFVLAVAADPDRAAAVAELVRDSITLDVSAGATV